MSDRERFTRQADEALAVLRRIADRVEAEGAQARADAIRAQARRLREHAFMAGAAEGRE